MLAKITPYLVAVVIAAASFFTGATTDVGTAVQIAVDKDQAAKACSDLINGKPAAPAQAATE